MGRYDEWMKDRAVNTGTESIPDAPGEDKAGPIPPEYREAAEDVTELPAGEVSGADSDTIPLSVEDESPLAGAGEDVKTVPEDIASRPVTEKLTPRYNNQTAFNDQIREDWKIIILSDPASFDALLFRPSNGTYGEVDSSTGRESYTELDNNQRRLTYDDPVLVKVLENPDGRESFQQLDSDTDQDALTDDVLIIRISEGGVPVGSILEWNEETNNGLVRRWWYVLRIYGYGTQRAGSVYYCVPARTFDISLGGKLKDAVSGAVGALKQFIQKRQPGDDVEEISDEK